MRKNNSPLSRIDRNSVTEQKIAYAIGISVAILFTMIILGSLTDQISYFFNFDDAGWVLR